MSERDETERHFGRDCPAGMVQVEFVGCPPEARYSDYGWKPVPSAFLELWVDGRRFRVEVGTFHDGVAERRGLHIVAEAGVQCEQTSINAASVFFAPAASAPPLPPQDPADAADRLGRRMGV